MFYENYERLCLERGEKPYALAVQLGAKNNAVVAQWKKGSVPRKAMLDKIAEYFGISVSELMYGKETAPAHDGPELSEDEVMLLAAFRTLTEEQRRFVLRQLRAAAQEPEDQAGV